MTKVLAPYDPIYAQVSKAWYMLDAFGGQFDLHNEYHFTKGGMYRVYDAADISIATAASLHLVLSEYTNYLEDFSAKVSDWALVQPYYGFSPGKPLGPLLSPPVNPSSPPFSPSTIGWDMTYYRNDSGYHPWFYHGPTVQYLGGGGMLASDRVFLRDSSTGSTLTLTPISNAELGVPYSETAQEAQVKLPPAKPWAY